jgi:hypothetical protein
MNSPDTHLDDNFDGGDGGLLQVLQEGVGALAHQAQHQAAQQAFVNLPTTKNNASTNFSISN